MTFPEYLQYASFFFCLFILIEMNFINHFCAATTVVHAADQLEEARFANAMHSACVLEKSLYFQIPQFCDAEGTASELAKQRRSWHQNWDCASTGRRSPGRYWAIPPLPSLFRQYPYPHLQWLLHGFGNSGDFALDAICWNHYPDSLQKLSFKPQ